MNKILIVDVSESDRRLMSGLLVKSGYEPIQVESMEAAKYEVAKLHQVRLSLQIRNCLMDRQFVAALPFLFCRCRNLAIYM